MNILLLGSGGREHALAWKIAASPLTDRLYLRAGQRRHRAGGRVRRARHRRPRGGDRVLQDQQDRLRRGRAGGAAGRRLVDDLEAAGIKTFGPTKSAAQLEGSKGFTKDLCRANNIPTAAYERFTSAEPAKAYVRKQGMPIVIKADGLAAGKGVIIPQTI